MKNDAGIQKEDVAQKKRGSITAKMKKQAQITQKPISEVL